MNSYKFIHNFLKKYPFTIAWRTRQHCKIIDKHLNPDEKIIYMFTGQKNDKVSEIFNTNVIALTDRRIMIATKRLLFGYFFTSVTPDMYNDLTVRKGLLFGSIILDTVKEVITITNIDPRALSEIETNVTEVMIEQKKKYGLERQKKSQE